MINLKELAGLTGFSTRTVTRALYNDGKIRPETRDKVLEVCKSLNYVPNFAARSLRLKKSYIIGLVRYFMNIEVDNRRVAMMSEELSRAGYSILQGFYQTEEKAKGIIQEFKHKCDALVIYTPQASREDGAFGQLQSENYPFVLVDPHPELASRYPSVSVDRETAIEQAVVSLGQSGKRGIGFLTPFSTYVNRFPGFKRGLAALGLSFDASRVIVIPTSSGTDGNRSLTDTSIVGEYMAGAYREVLKNSAIGRDFDALFCFSDNTALGCLRALYQRGIRVPEQVAVVGLDDDGFSAFTHVSLSTVRQPVETFARAIVQCVLDQIARRPVSSRTFAAEFIRRESS